ncbi:RNA ligase family protein [Amycolatopsis sp. H20-H5]|uniref:RNA ligase family protein n=1 Tax=Amycolatopsis sp. H20-H5 TaxID=3046309 RepID=UPI002DC0616D|nr:RNA ligase family protein [Amycolatopsis sp. H20-H5]MEC3980107.1 RNA ligase family protein [Amycolatopsis sp. H20-H5]
MTFDVRTVDLGVLNSLTKYPSIPTYHALDATNGGLLEECAGFDGPVIGTEKVDGTNARIISLPDGTFLLGSREELLYAKGDLIGNPAQGIVSALRPVAEALAPVGHDVVRVHYFEVYGGKITAAAKQYTGERAVGLRLFDVAVLSDYAEKLTWPPVKVSTWREDGGQRYLTEPELRETAERDGLELTPKLFTLEPGVLPSAIQEMSEFLTERLPRTLSALDGAAGGRAEGIVLRTPDRATIAKARFQDYERTLKRRR